MQHCVDVSANLVLREMHEEIGSVLLTYFYWSQCLYSSSSNRDVQVVQMFGLRFPLIWEKQIWWNEVVTASCTVTPLSYDACFSLYCPVVMMKWLKGRGETVITQALSYFCLDCKYWGCHWCWSWLFLLVIPFLFSSDCCLLQWKAQCNASKNIILLYFSGIIIPEAG
jgi:hypothetical protein